jgi:hypothetical protein
MASRAPFLPEKVLQRGQLIELRTWGWWAMAVYDSRNSPAGWLDVWAIRGDRIIYVENKHEAGVTRPDQFETVARLAAAGAEVWIVRESNLQAFYEATLSPQTLASPGLHGNLFPRVTRSGRPRPA